MALGSFPDLSDLKLRDMMAITADATKTVEWCVANGLLQGEMYCEDGSCVGMNPMVLEKRSDIIDGWRWRCSVGRKICRKSTSIRKGSFFENSNLAISEILQFLWFWCFEICKQKFVVHELGWSEHTVVDWKNFVRDVCCEYFLLNPVKLGGPGETVEIDESLFCRRKYEVGRLVKEQWVFGGYQPSTKEGFLACVEKRNADTLLPIIQQYIKPGTTVVSDLWAAYNTLSHIGYQHLTVNHSTNFVDPVTGATTNRVESMWQKSKGKNKERYGTHRSLIESYLQEFMWRQRFGANPFNHLVAHIRQVYPGAVTVNTKKDK